MVATALSAEVVGECRRLLIIYKLGLHFAWDARVQNINDRKVPEYTGSVVIVVW